MHAVETWQHKGLTVKVYQDEEAPNPRENFDHAGVMKCWHRRYQLGDEPYNDGEPGDFDPGQYPVCLPLYLYDHSGLTMSTGPFSCPWDSGQVGWIFVTRETVLKEWGGKGARRITKRMVKQAEKCLRAEVEEYDQYLRGDVYGYVIEGPDGEQLDSCWGFFGFDYAKEEACEAAEVQVEALAERVVKEREMMETAPV